AGARTPLCSSPPLTLARREARVGRVEAGCALPWPAHLPRSPRAPCRRALRQHLRPHRLFGTPDASARRGRSAAPTIARARTPAAADRRAGLPLVGGCAAPAPARRSVRS